MDPLLYYPSSYQNLGTRTAEEIRQVKNAKNGGTTKIAAAPLFFAVVFFSLLLLLPAGATAAADECVCVVPY